MKDKIKTIFLLGIFMLFSISGVLAVSCSPSSISQAYYFGNSSSSTLFCSNPANYSVLLLTSGETNNFNISNSILSSGSVNVPITIHFNPSAPVGIHSGLIFSSDNSSSTPISFLVQEQPQQQTGCIVDVFPTSMSNIKVQQGETKIRNIQLTIPSCFPSYVNLNGITLSTDEKPIQLGEMSLGIIQPGNSVNIPLSIDALGVSTGTYQDTLSILAYNSSGNRINLPAVSISVLVSAGISPINNFSFSQLPTCSLSATSMNLNNTYQMTCSKNNPNIMINPVIDNYYLVGVSVDETSTQYVYNFKAKNVGNTNISAEFTYANSQIGEPFVQGVRITNSGSSAVSGTSLDAVFYQGGISVPYTGLKATNTIINVVDNQTRNIVSGYTIILNGVNYSSNTFTPETGKTYELRISATSAGYSDKVFIFNVSSAKISVSIDQPKDYYYVGDWINASSDIENCSFLLNNQIVSPYFYLSIPGENVLKVDREGYEPFIMNLSVKPAISYSGISPQNPAEWKKGDNIVMNLTESSTWEVIYNGTQIGSGIGNSLSFKIDKFGSYNILINGKNILSQDVKILRSPFWEHVFKYWYFYAPGSFVLFISFLIIAKRKSNGSSGESQRRRTPIGGGGGGSSTSEFESGEESYDG